MRPEEHSLRVLVAGVGSIGRRHMRNLKQIGITDILLYRRQPGLVDEAPELPVFTDLDEALGAGPAAVIVATPTARHLDVALASARAGCHLMIEKPLSHSWDRVDELLAVVRDRNVVAMAGFDLRFDPGLCHVKALLDGEIIGRVVSVHAQVGQYLPDWHPAEDYRVGVSARVDTGGGVILDLIHELDYVRWLLGPVADVTCAAGHLSSLEIETEDVAALLLRFTSGAIGTVQLDYVQRIDSRSCRIVGEEGTILWDGRRRCVRWYETGSRQWNSYDYATLERNDRFVAEIRHFVDCIRGRAQPKVDAASASHVLRLALAAKHSAATRAAAPMEVGCLVQ